MSQTERTPHSAGVRPDRLVIDLLPHPNAAAHRRREAITIGVPLPQGFVPERGHVTLLPHASHEPVPLQTRALDTWPDRSPRWLLLDFQATLDGPAQLVLRPGGGVSSAPETLHVEAKSGEYVVDTGAAVFRGSMAAFWPQHILTRGKPATDSERSGLEVRDANRLTCALRVTSLRFEETGPLRAVLAVHGVAATRGEPLVDVTLRLHFFAGSPTVKCALTVRNPRRAVHKGGYWDLGDPGSVYLEDVTLNLALPGGVSAARVVCSGEIGSPSEAFETPFTLYQDSSGGANWQSSNHVNRHGQVPLRFRGYRIEARGTTREGLRATPVVGLFAGECGVAVAMPHFWQNCPKAIHATDGVLALRLFPREFGDVYELQGGEQKTHIFFVAFGPDAVTTDALDACRTPTVARLPASWYCDCQVVPFLGPKVDRVDDAYEALVSAGVDGPSSFLAKREVIDEYGWRHFGDIYGDHEAVSAPGPPPLVSHYNNQYDAIAGFAIQYFRSGDRRWWDMMLELAHHVVDIDVYHTTRDKAAYNGGLFWHTDHYVDAATATHRTYARSKATGGGGPGPDHNYTTGLMLHYLLTGDAASRETVTGLARWVVDMDDGRKTIFRFLSPAPTGLPTAFLPSREPGPSRTSGNSLNALIDGHRLDRDAGFLAKAEELIRRAVHPHDDVPGRQLLDVERKWFYTVFFQSLGKYLEVKADLAELDAMYAYGRDSLLHYARWMRVHEYRYLDKPELLEFPTESWAAHEIRKSEIFDVAAYHSVGLERDEFRERAEFFYHASIDTLSTMPTRTLARPLVIMLTAGYKHRYFLNHPDLVAPAPLMSSPNLGPPAAFVPQKAIAKRRFVALAAVGAFVLAIIAIVTLW